jgi:hypothetical protein
MTNDKRVQQGLELLYHWEQIAPVPGEFAIYAAIGR